LNSFWVEISSPTRVWDRQQKAIACFFTKGEILIHEYHMSSYGQPLKSTKQQNRSPGCRKDKEIQLTLRSLLVEEQQGDFPLLALMLLATFIVGISLALLLAYFPPMPTPQSASTFSTIEWILGGTLAILAIGDIIEIVGKISGSVGSAGRL
jgi:hypothetical protein